MDKILRQIYYSEDGFDSKVVTLKKAKAIEPSISKQDVDAWFEKQESQQLKRKSFYNSYVADHKLQQIHADIADFRQGSDDIEFKYAFIAIDIFSRFVVGCPMKGKTADDCKQALEFVIDKFGHFEELYTDSEGGLLSKPVIALFNKHKIKHISTYGKAFHAEKAIHIIKMAIHARLQGLKLDADEWPRLLPKVIHKYNYDTVSTAHNLTPYDATKDANKIEVWLHIYRKSRETQKYDKIQVGDQVRIMLQKKTFTKNHDPKFSPEIYTVIYVATDGGYLINNPDHRRVWWRHELRLVKAAENKDTVS
jgi:hypothetical protein